VIELAELPVGVEVVKTYGSGTSLIRCWHPEGSRKPFTGLYGAVGVLCGLCKGDDMERPCLLVVKLAKSALVPKQAALF
jgi:hypothetical protein